MRMVTARQSASPNLATSSEHLYADVRGSKYSQGMNPWALPDLYPIFPVGIAAMKELFVPPQPIWNARDYQRQRQMTIGDLLLENRIIFLQGEIYDGNANEVVMKMLYLQSENRRKDIHFYINSPGGSVTATLAMYDTMQILSCPVATYCVGI